MGTQIQQRTAERQLLTTQSKKDRTADSHANIAHMAVTQAEHRAEHRHAMTAQRAYLRAEKRGFAPGHEIEDWLAAELEVEATERMSVLCPSDGG